MKVVVSDTSPIHYLLLIGQVDLLHSLYREIIIPQAVLSELLNAHAPEKVRAWASQPPWWLQVMRPLQLATLPRSLDRGEHEAISIAMELNADLLLLDESAARATASSLGLSYIGTIGIIGIITTAAKQRVINKQAAEAAFEALRKTNKRIHPQILEDALTIVRSLS